MAEEDTKKRPEEEMSQADLEKNVLRGYEISTEMSQGLHPVDIMANNVFGLGMLTRQNEDAEFTGAQKVVFEALKLTAPAGAKEWNFTQVEIDALRKKGYEYKSASIELEKRTGETPKMLHDRLRPGNSEKKSV